MRTLSAKVRGLAADRHCGERADRTRRRHHRAARRLTDYRARPRLRRRRSAGLSFRGLAFGLVPDR
jgi:hypothetical protein